MVRVECLWECQVNRDGSQVISVNILEYVVHGLNLMGTVFQLCAYSSPRVVKDCITTLSTGRETEKQAMFLAILWLENYEPEAQWAMDDCPQEWDPKVSELLDRLFR